MHKSFGFYLSPRTEGTVRRNYQNLAITFHGAEIGILGTQELPFVHAYISLRGLFVLPMFKQYIKSI